ncbi:hypothetical protein [Nostoc sp. FACHB-888]|uniref:hypothetical protein n=1 Tax=Nostoc sp. FACHB-888 TaxID=2692842 RepID=UPI001687179E|nr:hypothetical protein [Nostoc sp. FACHB-888]MBD2243216.1 hypothetical protein [Nostoc sp. FACHB-888]
MWKELGVYTLQFDWIVTPIINAEVFRITHLSVPVKQQDYIKAVIGLEFSDGLLPNIFSPQRLTSRQEREIFYFTNFDNSPRRLIFKRLEKREIIWNIKVEFKNMLIPSNKPRVTIAQPLADINVSNVKAVILRERSDLSRQNYLLTNSGSQTVFFRYVPMGTDPTNDTLLVSSTNWDFFIEAGRQWYDQTFSQNGLIAIASGNQAVRIKAVEYNYL